MAILGLDAVTLAILVLGSAISVLSLVLSLIGSGSRVSSDCSVGITLQMCNRVNNP